MAQAARLLLGSFISIVRGDQNHDSPVGVVYHIVGASVWTPRFGYR